MNARAVRVLVTATGGDVGQAIVKALRVSGGYEVHGCDGGSPVLGAVFVESFRAVPPANRPDYLASLDEICRRLRIDFVIPGSEPEMRALSRAASFPKLPAGATLICHSAEWIEVFADKLRCMAALEGKIDLAPYSDASDAARVEAFVRQNGFPLVVKSRTSHGSKSVRIAREPSELAAHMRDVADPFLQVFLDGQDQEYSVGVFRGEGFETAVSFRRNLGPAGCSWWAETSDDREVLEYAKKTATAANLRGSANVQLRKTRSGPRLLEINARFSSLAAARALTGFTDVHWSIEAARGRKIAPPAEYKSLRFQRFFGEIVDRGSGFEKVKEWQPA